MTDTTDPHVYVVREIRDGVSRRTHGYFASLQGAFSYSETEERKKPLIDGVRFDLFAVPGGSQWLIHCFYGPDDRTPETSDFVISRHEVMPDAPVAPSAPADRAGLRDRIAAAMREHYLCTDRNEADADGNLPCRCGDWREPGAEVDDENDWDAHLTDAVMSVLPPAADRGAVLREAADALAALDPVDAALAGQHAWTDAAALLRRMADEAEYVAAPCDFAACEPGGEPCSVHERLMAHAEGDHELCKPDCGPGRVADEEQQPETQAEEVALLRLTVDAVEEGRRELRTENARLRAQLWTLAAALDGLHTLIATSSRDWGTYRVDAWLWAILCGWDCEEAHEHDELCDDGAAMAEMQERHGWSDEAVAKARRYRAAVHVLTEPAVVAEPGKENGHG